MTVIAPIATSNAKPQMQLAYSKSLLLRKVPRRSTDADIRTVFETFGPVRDIYTPRNFDTGRRETYAFIEFVELRDAIKAFSFLQANEMLLEGVILRADFARNGRRSAIDMRGETGALEAPLSVAVSATVTFSSLAYAEMQSNTAISA